MSLTEILGVLGFLLALGSLGWQIFSRCVRLKVEIDEERSGFATLELRPKDGKGAQAQTRTGLRILLDISNVSIRSNTVFNIVTQPEARLEPLPDDVRFIADVRYEPDSMYDKSIVNEVATDWDVPRCWVLPHSLLPGDRHQAGLAFLLVGDPLPKDVELAVEVTVIDAFDKRYRQSVRLSHD